MYEALLDACLEARQRLSLTNEEKEELLKATTNRTRAGGAKENQEKAPRLLLLAFRVEKSRVLDEAIARFRRLTGQEAQLLLPPSSKAADR